MKNFCESNIIVSHPFGNANVRAVLKALAEGDRLHQFLTTIGISEERELGLLPLRLQSEIRRRSYSLRPDQISISPIREIIRHLAKRWGIQKLTEHESGWASIDQVWRSLDRRVADYVSHSNLKCKVVYAYEDGALDTFRAAKKNGLKCVYDLPIGYWRKAREVYRREREINPEFASILGGVHDSDEKCERKEEEIHLADKIIACSPFVKKSLTDFGVKEEKIQQVQFGSPLGVPIKNWSSLHQEKKLRLLFVGRIDQRKGIGYLLRAVKSLGKSKLVDLHILGEQAVDQTTLAPYEEYFTYQKSCSKEQVLEQMRNSDLLVLPTLFEGQALVVLEAMASGIPVMVTRSSGAEEVVRDGIEGWMIEEQSEQSIVDRLEWIMKNRQALPEMGFAAAKRAENFTWASYENKILEIIQRTI